MKHEILGTAINASRPDPDHPGEHTVDVAIHGLKPDHTPELVAMVETLLPFAEMVQDEGPANGEGWKSAQLEGILAQARQLLAKVKAMSTTEIVYRWPDGREEVRYRRPFGSEGALLLMAEVAALQHCQGDGCPYFVRHV
jgi:hypothetical protein